MTGHAWFRPSQAPLVTNLLTSLLAVLTAAAWPRVASAAPEMASREAEEQAAIQAAAARVAPSTVRIEVIGIASGKEAAAGAGPSTGLVVAQDGWIVTTSFAATEDSVELVAVLPDGERFPARIVARDRSNTIVLVKIDPAKPLPVPVAAPKAGLRVGQWAIALGRGWNAPAAGVSVGVVSALDRAWGRAVQTDASVSPANYGGPLVDISGRVIGVLAPLPADTAGMTLGTELYDSGIGFAVPLEDILARLPSLREGRSIAPGLLGVSYTSRDAFTQAAVIATVRAGSPAAKAGLRSGDRIVEANGKAVTRIAELRHVLAGLTAGDALKLGVERAATRDANDAADAGPERIDVEAVLVDALPPYRRPCLGIGLARGDDPTAGERGLEVAWVWPEGPAAKGGIVAGDRIRSIEPVDRPDTSADAISGAMLSGIVAGGEVGGTFRVVFDRGGTDRTVEIAAGPVPVALPPRPLVEVAGDAKAKPAATIERIEAADLPDGCLAVLPAESDVPVGAVVILGSARKDAKAAATVWQQASSDANVAVLLPASGNPMRWTEDDVPGIVKALRALAKKRTLDPSRVAVVGLQAGGPFAWSLAQSLGAGVRGVAVLDGGLPRRGEVPTADPSRPLAVLVARPAPDADDAEAARRRLEADVERLEKAGIPFGVLPAPSIDPIPCESLCQWVESLGML